jgi:hypothetical protein
MPNGGFPVQAILPGRTDRRITMSTLSRSRRLARRAGCAALSLGLAGAVAAGTPAALAQARGALPVVNRHARQRDHVWQQNDARPGQRARHWRRPGCGRVRPRAGRNVQRHGLGVGNNGYGQLGDGNQVDSDTPVQVMGLSGVTAVAAGDRLSLALRSDGTVWAWGANEFGQLGNRVTSTAQLTPVQVTGLTGVTKIAAGDRFSLAPCSDGTVWAWGSNGHLGNGATASSSVPVRVKGPSQVTSIAAGSITSLAVCTRSITALTSVWAWGGNVGDGTTNDRLTPCR